MVNTWVFRKGLLGQIQIESVFAFNSLHFCPWLPTAQLILLWFDTLEFFEGPGDPAHAVSRWDWMETRHLQKPHLQDPAHWMSNLAVPSRHPRIDCKNQSTIESCSVSVSTCCLLSRKGQELYSDGRTLHWTFRVWPHCDTLIPGLCFSIRFLIEKRDKRTTQKEQNSFCIELTVFSYSHFCLKGTTDWNRLEHYAFPEFVATSASDLQVRIPDPQAFCSRLGGVCQAIGGKWGLLPQWLLCFLVTANYKLGSSRMSQ